MLNRTMTAIVAAFNRLVLGADHPLRHLLFVDAQKGKVYKNLMTFPLFWGTMSRKSNPPKGGATIEKTL